MIHAKGQNLVINEIMSNNERTIKDQDSDFVDWIELYNNSDSSINLLGFFLSDDYNNLGKWVFPEITISPHEFLIIFASGKNITETSELHTNFKISLSGEEIFLSNSFGIMISQVAEIDLAIDETYGRFPDASPNWIKINTPSPKQSNNTSNRLIFSHTEGFFDSSFYLKISSLLVDTIYYTLDGSLPTDTSHIFIDSIFIQDVSSSANILSEIPTSPEQHLIWFHAFQKPSGLIHKGVVLRCASYNKGIRTSKVYTKSFFVGNNVLDKYSLPVISLVTDKNNFFNADTGIYVPGVHYNETDPINTGNYFQRGEYWERLLHIEYFDTNGNIGFAQNAGVRIHGGATRHAAQKSLRLYARREYGTQHFNYQLLPQKDVSQYKRFILRSSMSGGTMIRDDIAQDISMNLNIESQNSLPVIVFINGEYWGVHTIKDRIDERYIEYTYNIDKDSVEFKGWSNPDYENLMNFIEFNDLSDNTNYDYVKEQIDINNFIDYYISEIFFANYDWPANNVKCWRVKNNGRWRWVLYDLDFSFFEEDYNMFSHLTNNDSTITWPNSLSSTFLFRSLMKNKLFSNQFSSRYIDILNSDFCIENMVKVSDKIVNLYKAELSSHINRWGYPLNFQDDVDKVFSFLNNRTGFEVQNISDFFDIDLAVNDFCSFDSLFSEKLVVYPNPNSGIFYIYNNSLDICNGFIDIINVCGTFVFNSNNFLLNPKESKYFDFSYLPSNLYFLRVNDKVYKILIIK